MTSRSVGDFVQSEDRLRILHGEARRLGRLQARLDELLPVWVSGCVSVAAARDGVLTIVTSSPAVASSVSQIAPRIAAEIRKSDAEVTSIKVTVQPGEARTAASAVAHPPEPLSARTRANLMELAANVSDQRLKKALEALGTRKSAPR
ncbi:MAG: DciA family protein [Burkholderiales bacterium]|nr:DciA family protein [Burkholderiales bacterium]